MKTLVVAATEMEIAPFRENNTGAEILITGAGIPSTVYSLLKALHTNKYDLVVQAGVAGSFFSENVETFAVRNDRFADIGVFENAGFKSIFEMGLADDAQAPFTSGMLQNPYAENFGLPVCDAITVNTINEDSRINNLFCEKYNASIESMEGAAFHYVCLQENVRFVQLRTVSNLVGERDKSKWKLQEAIEQLNQHLLRIVNG